jgi:hypothetical protein
MTRFLALSIAISALAFSACEKHPLPGQQAVTSVPGIDGLVAGHEASNGAPEGKKDEHSAPAPEKKEGAAASSEAKH